MRPDRPPGAGERLAPGHELFHVSWAVYVIASLLSTYFSWLQFSDPATLAAQAALGGLAVLVIARPSSLAAVSALNAVLAVKYVAAAPFLNNHSALTLAVCVTLLLAYLPAVVRPPAPAALWSRTRAVLAAELVLMYFFVVLHKLNRDFLDPGVSCAVAMYRDTNAAVGGHLPDPGPALGYALIAGTLAAEAVIPVLLAVPRWRAAGLGVGLAFHALLMFHPNAYIMGYSSLMYALYVVFLPEAVAGRVLDAVLRRRRAALGGLAAWAGVWLLFVVARAAQSGPVDRQAVIASLHRDAGAFLRVSWLLFYAGAAAAVVRAYRASRPWAEDRVFRAAALAHPAAAVLVLMALNGLAPYLGAYSSHSWSMFSNLRAEGADTNHALIPGSARVFPFLADTWLVRDCSDPEVAKLAEGGRQQTLVEIRRHLNRDADPSRFVVMARPGEPFRRVEFRAEPDHPVFRPLPYWQRKLFLSRSVPRDDQPCPCVH